MPHPEQPLTRRAARAAAGEATPRHARRARARRATLLIAAVASVAALVGGAAAVTSVLAGPDDGGSAEPAHTLPAQPDAPAATDLPVPAQTGTTAASCSDPGVVSALADGTDAEVIAAFGGAEAFRVAAVNGAPCIDLTDASRTWVFVNKQNPLDPLEFAPASVIPPENMQRTADVRLRPDAAAALTALVAAASEEGAGRIGLNSAYRSYASQVRTYNGYVSSLGRAQADRQSARPGFSEHQTGLATDVVACSSGCAGIESFGGTTQADWVADNAWRFGFIVRYEEGETGTTGYEWEPWHLRYLGPDLAQAYHDGGFHTLEDFFGYPAAADYAD